MIIQGQVGAPSNQASQAPGTNPTIRLGQLSDIIVSELHGRYYETTYRQSMFSTFVNAVTLAATHATPLTAGTGTPIIGIFNPIGSGKNISIVRVQQATTSGTPGGPLVWNIVPNAQNITAATNAIPYNMATLQQTGAVARLWNNTAVTGSTAGVAFRNAGGATAVAATGAVMTYVEEYAGSFIVPPGSMIALTATAAGTSHIVNAWVEWEEIPI